MADSKLLRANRKIVSFFLKYIYNEGGTTFSPSTMFNLLISQYPFFDAENCVKIHSDKCHRIYFATNRACTALAKQHKRFVFRTNVRLTIMANVMVFWVAFLLDTELNLRLENGNFVQIKSLNAESNFLPRDKDHTAQKCAQTNEQRQKPTVISHIRLNFCMPNK